MKRTNKRLALRSEVVATLVAGALAGVRGGVEQSDFCDSFTVPLPTSPSGVRCRTENSCPTTCTSERATRCTLC